MPLCGGVPLQSGVPRGFRGGAGTDLNPGPASALVCGQRAPYRRLGWRWSRAFTARCNWGLSSAARLSLALEGVGTVPTWLEQKF